MNITLPPDTQRLLQEMVQNYQTGDVCLDELITQSKCSTRQLANTLFTIPDFLAELGSARHYIPSHSFPIYISTLSKNPGHLITLLGIPKGYRIPLHDHPEMVSIVLFLSGRIHSPRYLLVSEKHGNRIVELIRCSDYVYSECEVVVLTPNSCNLHSLEALTTHAACLSVQIGSQYRMSDQSYYFPFMHDPSASTCDLWHRVPPREQHHGM